MDRGVRDHVQALVARHLLPGLDLVAEYWTDLGSVLVAVPLLGLAAGHACRRARRTGSPDWWRSGVTALLAVGALLATVLPAKDLIARHGPSGSLPSDGGYFPSGHTATATVCLVVAGWLLSAGRHPRMTGTLLAVLCTGVGAGLVWRDYHWLTDVLAAWCLSGVILWFIKRFRL